MEKNKLLQCFIITNINKHSIFCGRSYKNLRYFGPEIVKFCVHKRSQFFVYNSPVGSECRMHKGMFRKKHPKISQVLGFESQVLGFESQVLGFESHVRIV